MKSPLSVSPLPVQRLHDDTEHLRMEREGFVDEAVVAALCVKPALRRAACPDDLALSADDHDFAGWQMPNVSGLHADDEVPDTPPLSFRRASPPTEQSAQQDNPVAAKKYRWWVAALAGVLFSLITAAALYLLASSLSGDSTASSQDMIHGNRAPVAINDGQSYR